MAVISFKLKDGEMELESEGATPVDFLELIIAGITALEENSELTVEDILAAIIITLKGNK